jgi:DNA-directed RNA polymerase subunit L
VGEKGKKVPTKVCEFGESTRVTFPPTMTSSVQQDFTFPGEDHTIGNLLVNILDEDPEVDFAGQRIDHESNDLVIKIGAVDPSSRLVAARDKAVALLSALRQSVMDQA